MALFVTEYTYSPDIALRDEIRPAHRAYLGALADDGRLLVSGPAARDGVDGAFVVLDVSDQTEVARLLDQDPFAISGVVVQRQISAFTPVLGRWSRDPSLHRG